MTGMTFLILFLVLMLLLAIVPLLLKKFHVPGVIAMMVIGIVIGPNCLNLIGRLNMVLGRGFPAEQLYAIIEAMGLLGLVFLMTLAGMEVDLRDFRTERKPITLLSILTFTLPAVAGYWVYRHFMPNDLIGKLLYASLFASHSVGIVFPVIRELKAVRTRFGIAVLVSTVITDIASLILLALCVQMKRHQLPVASLTSLSVFDHIDISVFGPFFFILFILATGVFIVLNLWLVPFVGQMVFKKVRPGDDAMLTFFLAAVLLVAFVGELIGINVIVAAFIAGMALVRIKSFHDDGGILHHKLEGAGYGIMIPFLFLSIGMRTNIWILFGAWENLSIVSLTVVGLLLSKIFSGWLAMKLSGFDQIKSLLAGLMTVPQLSATLAAAAVGLELGMIDERFFNAIIVLSIVTTLPVPILIKLLIIKFRVRFEPLADGKQTVTSDRELDETLI